MILDDSGPTASQTQQQQQLQSMQQKDLPLGKQQNSVEASRIVVPALSSLQLQSDHVDALMSSPQSPLQDPPYQQLIMRHDAHLQKHPNLQNGRIVVQSAGRNRDDQQQMNKSLDASRTNLQKHSNQNSQRQQMQANEVPSVHPSRIVPGAPLLEQALSQKQFIIKKGQGKSHKRGKSKNVNSSAAGATTTGLLRAYFPNLIAKKDVTMVSPTAFAQQYTSQNAAGQQVPQNSQYSNASQQQQQQVHTGANQKKVATNSVGKKFIRHSKSSQPGGGGSGGGASNMTPTQGKQDARMNALQFQKEHDVMVSNGSRATGEIIVLGDYHNSKQPSSNHTTIVPSTAQPAYNDDYGRHQHLNQEGSNNGSNLKNHSISSGSNAPAVALRKQRSHARNLEPFAAQQSSDQSYKRVRRNSFAGQDSSKPQDTSGMLPPIFSGPSKKSSTKAQLLIQQHSQHQQTQNQVIHVQQVSVTPGGHRKQQSNLSEKSPMRNNVDIYIATQASATAVKKIPDQEATNSGGIGQDLDLVQPQNPAASGTATVPQNSRKTVIDLSLSQQPNLPQKQSSIVLQSQQAADCASSNAPKVNFVKKNEERLKEMQEQRARELKEIEDQRNKLLRRQEKLKMNVLKEAASVRNRKANRNSDSAGHSINQIGPNEIKLDNLKNLEHANRNGFTSPTRSGAAKLTNKSVNLTSPNTRLSLGAPGADKSSQNASNIRKELGLADEKTHEEKAEEKKKMDMMRQFYRNRHSSFLQGLQEQKAKKEKDEHAKRLEEEKRLQKVKQQVLGDGSHIRSKFKDGLGPTKTSEDSILNDNQVVALPAALSHVNKAQLNSTTQSAASNKTSGKETKTNSTNNMLRGNSISSLSQVDHQSSSYHSAHKRALAKPESRGSTRAASSKGTAAQTTSQTTESKVPVGQDAQANRSAQNFNRGRTLTPKVRGANTAVIHKAASMTVEEQLVFDEKREQEILKEAADRKARAQAIRERQEKQLNAIKEKVAKEREKEQAEIERKKRMHDLARNQVQQRQEELKNMPTLREQQDSRMKNRGEEEAVASPSKPKPVDPEAFNNFLERNKTMTKTVQLNITDMKEWKKKNRVEHDTKVFIIKGGYRDVKEALKSRGWVHNKERESPCFDFMWTLKAVDVPHAQLSNHQIVNHFAKAASITTKVGLTHSLKNLIWFNSVDIDHFFPRCYDLAIGEELDDFIAEFKQLKAVGYMKIYVREMREAFQASGNSSTEEIKSATVTDQIYKIAMKVCKHRTRDLDDLIDDPNAFDCLINDQEWAVLSSDEHSDKSLAAKKHDQWMKSQQPSAATAPETKAAAKKKKKKKKGKKKTRDVGSEDDEYDEEYDDEYDDESEDESEDYGDEDGDIVVDKETQGNYSTEQTCGSEEVSKKPASSSQGAVFAQSGRSEEQKAIDKLIGQRYPKFAEAVQVLDTLREKYPQFNLDGERNIWILKPAGSSRGRGICLKRDLCEILDLIRFKDPNQTVSNQRNGQLYICQKYIENTLIIKNRKFDIRQWVLVTDWNPLTIWIYAEPYIRFPAADFDFNKISNRYAHLSNNSVAKHGKKVTVTHHIEGNMWDLETFQKYLTQTYGHDVWEERLYDSIKNIVINSLESVQDNFEQKKGVPFEMFGYDIMIDEDFNCWLIEVNSSPAMDYSTEVTERLVKMVLEDTIKVVIDYGLASEKKRRRVDTGGFECVYKAKRIVDKPMNSFGLNMEVVGKKIPKGQLKKY